MERSGTLSEPSDTLYKKRDQPFWVSLFRDTPEEAITPQLVARLLSYLPWGHIRTLLDKKLNASEAIFYACKAIEHGWSRAVLLNMIGGKLYESSGKSVNNFKITIPGSDSDYANEIIKDPYNFGFLKLRENYKEADLQAALEQNLIKFLTELGQGFAYVGRQVRFEVDGKEFFCDLLFYHLKLRRYIVVELKAVEFEPEFVSKVNFYCNAVNHLIKRPDEGDTIGLLICREKNDLVAQ